MKNLSTWTIYKSPSDYLGLFVVREFSIVGGRSIAAPVPLIVTRSLGLARASIPPDTICVGRQPEDDPVIIETWM